jgi:hypothetical protein
MKMPKLIILWTIILFSVISLSIFIHEKRETYSVTLENGTTFEATRVTYYNSGIVDIRKTNNERVQIPTRAIKQVKVIESK